MKNSRKTAGVTLVVTVLIVMLLLAGVVVVTGQLALASRRSSADQDATIQAQYVAESGIARAQARLGQARTLINQGTLDQATTTVTTLSSLFANFCGVSLSGVADLTLTVGSTAAPTLLCTASANSTTTGAAVASLIPSAAYSGVSGWSASTWDDLFSTAGSVINGVPSGSGTNALGITGKVALKAINVQKVGIDTYLLNMSVADVTSSAANAGTKRALISSSSGIFSLKIARPPFSTFAQFRNQTTATAANGGGNLYFSSGESFNGPVHTNSQLRLSGNPGPTFYGEVTTSAGSTGNPSIDFNGIAGNCGSNSNIRAGNCPQMYPDGATTYPTYVPSIALPTNNNSQFRAALGQSQVVDIAGLPVAPTAADVALALGVVAPVPTGVYYSRNTSPTTMTGGMYVKGDADVKLSTTGSAPVQQVIEITQPPGFGVLTRFQQNSNGSWTVKVGSGPINTLSGSFNGMLYVDGNVNMYGGGTTSPDVASNTALTISNTGGDIKLKNSITYAECPVSVNCPTGSTANPNATNVLGFYSATGSVLLDGPQGADMDINATVLASATGKGFGSVRSYRATRTKINLIGGVIEDQSQTVSAGSNDGYIRNYTYDTRFKSGYSPPYFPLQQRWVVLPDTKFDIGTLRQSQ